MPSGKRQTRQERRAATRSRNTATTRSRRGEKSDSPPTVLAAVTGSGRWVSLGLVALILVVYAAVRHFTFISLDDPQYVSANPRIADGLTWDGMKWAFVTGEQGNWHPLTWISHMLDIEMFGMNAGAHHLTSVLIHTVSTVLLFAVLYQSTRALGRSAFVAAMFAVHPLHVESVAWVAERKDVLSTFFWMLTLAVYVDYVRNPRFARKILVILFFTLGLMSKPMVVTLPFALLLLDYWPLGRVPQEEVRRISSWWPLVREKLPLFALSLASAVVTFAAQKSTGAVIAVGGIPVAARTGNALVSYIVYMRDMIWPRGLAVFYPFESPSVLPAVAAGLILTAITVMAVRLARRVAYVPVGWAWYVGTMIPVIGLVQVGAQGRADRYTYLPMIGLFIIIAWGAYDLALRFRMPRAVLAAASGLIIAASAVACRQQVKYWANDLALWERAVRVTRENYRAENHYGVALTDNGRLAEGIEHYTAAIKIWPEYPEGHNNLGTARMEQARYDDAIREFAAASRTKPRNATFRYNLAAALDAAGRRPEALKELRTALTMNPGNQQLLQALEILGGAKQ